MVLGVSGPFETFALMPPLGRIGYWAAVVVATYATGFFTAQVIMAWLGSTRDGPLPARTTLAPLTLGITATVMPVLLALSAGLGIWPETLGDAAFLGATVLLVTLAIQIVGLAMPGPAAASPPAILDRLPVQKRGPLLSISVSDHYVDVATTKGREMLLMRFSDAIREAGSQTGLQVHRSHWVVQSQIAGIERRGDSGLLTMTDGRQVPVSRTGMKRLAAAGLLPVKGR